MIAGNLKEDKVCGIKFILTKKIGKSIKNQLNFENSESEYDAPKIHQYVNTNKVNNKRKVL